MPKKNNELTAEISKRILARRKELKLTQEKAADAAGLSRAYYACIENGRKGVGADSIIKICSAFDISIDYLLTGAMQPAEKEHVNRMLELLNEEQRKSAEAILENLLLACGYKIPKK